MTLAVTKLLKTEDVADMLVVRIERFEPLDSCWVDQIFHDI